MTATEEQCHRNFEVQFRIIRAVCPEAQTSVEIELGGNGHDDFPVYTLVGRVGDPIPVWNAPQPAPSNYWAQEVAVKIPVAEATDDRLDRIAYLAAKRLLELGAEPDAPKVTIVL